MDFLTVNRQVSSSSEKKEDGVEVNEGLVVDNSKCVLYKIATLYAEQLMSDLTLEVGGVGYPSHRLILCASSEVFQVMLMNREWSEWRESRIVLQETPTATSVFPHFLKYFYTGQIRISHETVLPILSLADKYNVKDLVALCLRYMSQNIAQAAKRGQLISWMQYTMACGHNEVAKIVSLVNEIIRLPTLLANHPDTENTLNAPRRFPMMCPNQLAKLLLCPLTQEHKDFFMERMAIAMSYQSGQFERVAEIQQTEAGRMLFTPRLYTEDTWGSVLAVDNFHSLPCYHTRTFIFSTRPSIADVAPQDKLTEWTVDLYPKGVWFRKSLLIIWAGTYDVPEVVLRTVRISITCQNCPEFTVNQYGETEQLEPDVRVKVLKFTRFLPSI
ncbi:hypothetical protein HF086_018326 [Spodoptera exigua]|uniref:BTB domain-containing protein n=1 Tax=Spodoptera exigua TaxID=7107 RepID=A0A922M1G9_SPOEX|nr:hypothetical protein HF086_018326 [Spodoptera exigua]